jgi:hypothetical protein
MTLALVLRQNNAAAYPGVRITWAQLEYTASTPVTISCGVGGAVAAGATAGVSVSSYGGVRITWAEAAYAATAYTGVRVTWAEAQYQATPSAAVLCGVGNAIASGPIGATVSVDVSIATDIGDAVAAGPVGATVSVDLSIGADVGNAVAAGATADAGTVGLVRITWAEAAYQATAGAIVACSTGNAVASGPIGATVSVDVSIGADTGNAVATGPVGATVSVDLSIDADIGGAVAAGATAGVSVDSIYSARITWAEAAYLPDPNVVILCGTGGAIAAGLRADILPPLVSTGATPGPVSPRPRYRVRIGLRWVEVDPLDPMSVRRAVDAAQEEGQEAAAENTESPAEVAAQAVVMGPIIGPDYAALAREAKRINESIRKAFADALQTELISRLMREQIERDDEDDIAVLLASI